MSEESYIKAPCCECNGRVSLPLDAVGVDFNCPHCGAGLQMLLKHVCEHCNGKLSFDTTPDAIGTEIECGHCHEQTVLSPSTFSTENLEESATTAESEEVETEEVEEYSDAVEDKQKRSGPPRPRAGRRGSGPPRPRNKKADSPKPDSDNKASEAAPEKIGRRLAGSAGEAKPENVPTPKPKPKSSITQSRPSPKRSSRIESVEEARAPSPRKGAVPPPQTTEVEQPIESSKDPMDPMSGVVPGSSAENPRPVGGGGAAPAPVQRKVAGMGGASDSGNAPKPIGNKGSVPEPVIRKVSEEDEDDEPRSIPKWAMGLGGVGLLLLFVYFLLPTGVEIFDVSLARDIRKYTRFQFGGEARVNSTEDFKWDNASVSLNSPSGVAGVMYVTGNVSNNSDKDYKEVEVQIELYDAQGQLMGQTMDFTNQLGSKLTWSFRAACPWTNAATAKITKVVAK
ncbi:MAG: FxLYD domain-containing protein [Verrucomicrobiota bacterium]|nr:FxLYD domain-containing protein [Verrucomicrobiota bacterium]MEE2812944.1 FxLYD domain-containing protein [Verrucomicrobiota bacterium]